MWKQTIFALDVSDRMFDFLQLEFDGVYLLSLNHFYGRLLRRTILWPPTIAVADDACPGDQRFLTVQICFGYT